MILDTCVKYNVYCCLFGKNSFIPFKLTFSRPYSKLINLILFSGMASEYWKRPDLNSYFNELQISMLALRGAAASLPQLSADHMFDMTFSKCMQNMEALKQKKLLIR